MKNCWIIGASHGIGEDLAYELYNEDYNLILSGRDFDKLKLIEHTLTNEGQSRALAKKVIVSQLDVSDLESLSNSFAQIIEEFDKIDLVIFCCGLYKPMAAASFDLQMSKKIIDVNLGGFLNVLHFVLPSMIKQNSGHIAAIASVAGYFGMPQSFAYGASKAGLINLCEGIYQELKEKNITLSVINPGFVKTRLTDQNKFSMPFIISSKDAAKEICLGLKKRKFEIHFPKKFTLLLKFLRILPYKLFFLLMKKIS
jgi:short-subunit dehydrogenase